MHALHKAIPILLFIQSFSFHGFGQVSNQLILLNNAIIELKGNDDRLQTPIDTFSSMSEACEAHFIDCNENKQIESIHFRALYLTGIYGKHTEALKNELALSYIDCSFNALEKEVGIQSSLGPQYDLEKKIYYDYVLALQKQDTNRLLQYYFLDADQKKAGAALLKHRSQVIDSIAGLTHTSNSVNPTKENEVFKVVEQMPRFPGCETNDPGVPDADKQKCANEKMLHYLYSQLRYPAEARENGIEGMVVVQYMVTKSGLIDDISVIRDIGGGCDEAVRFIIENMNHTEHFWMPGIHKEGAVDVLFTLPVKFKLEN